MGLSTTSSEMCSVTAPSQEPTRLVTLRRRLEQIKHCVKEAISVMERREDARCAADDLEQALSLLEQVLPEVKSQARGWQKSSEGTMHEKP